MGAGGGVAHEVGEEELADGQALRTGWVRGRARRQTGKGTGSKACRIASASFNECTWASSTLCMPRTYLGKSDCSAASTGALSTGIKAPVLSGQVSAIVIATLAPLVSFVSRLRSDPGVSACVVHRVPDQRGARDLLAPHELLHVGRQRRVVMPGIVRRVAVVAEVLVPWNGTSAQRSVKLGARLEGGVKGAYQCIDGYAEVAGNGSECWSAGA